MDYTYRLANASLTLRVVEHLNQAQLPVRFMTVIHQIDGWVIKIQLAHPLPKARDKDLVAFLSEMGIPYSPDVRLQMTFWGLETGQSPVDVMRRYQVAIVSHGAPDSTEIKAFRSEFVRGLGYCPETLA